MFRTLLVIAGVVAWFVAPLAAQTQFRPGPKTPSPIYASGTVVTGDVDGDFDSDLVFLRLPSARLGRLGVMLNSGDGTFTEAQGALFSNDFSLASLLLLDTDADGDLDLIAGSITNGRARGLVYQFENDGRGKFTDVTSKTIPLRFIGVSALLSFDVDGDGDQDLFIGSNHPQQDHLYLNNGKGVFTDATAGSTPGSLRTSRSAVAGDIDGDADADVIIVDGDLRIYRNRGKGVFSENIVATVQQFSRDPQLVDIDGDRDLDLLVLNSDVQVFVNDGTGRFIANTGTGLPRGTPTLVHFAVADFDVDGDPDVWVGNGDPGCTLSACRPVLDQLFVNDGKGSFTATPPRVAGSPGATSRVTVLDLDLDGDQDVLQVQRPSRNPVTYIAQQWINQHRQLTAGATVRRGGVHGVELFHRPGYAAAAATAVPFLALRSVRIPIPGLGVVGLDPTVMVPLQPVSIPATPGKLTLSFSVPNDPKLQGVVFYMQAVVGNANGVGLTSAVQTRIL